MFVRVVAPETKFAVGPLAQAGGWGPWHARGTGSGKWYIFVDEGYEQRFFFASAPTVCCAPESTWLEKLQSTAFFSVDKTCRQAHA